MSRLSEIEAHLTELRSQQEADKRELPTRDTWAVEQRAIEDLATLLRLVREARELLADTHFSMTMAWVRCVDTWLEETT